MTASMPTPGFRNRDLEFELLDDLVASVRAGVGRGLVVHGDAGIGKTALLERLVERSPDFRVSWITGVESEMQLAYAGLHQFCSPMLDSLTTLPAPQQDALGAAFGMSDALADPLLIGLAVLGLISEHSQAGPLLCVIDDGQWLDRASAQALGLVARRLGAESAACVIAVRDPVGPQWDGVPTLPLSGLSADDARWLLESVVAGALDERVRDRLIDETRGNPLALLELPRGLRPSELAGGYAAPIAGPLPRRIEESFLRRVAGLPAETRLLLLVAAADPVSERGVVLRAAEQLGVTADAAAPAQATGLCDFGPWVRFRHPLVRSAVYRSASLTERRAVHRALGHATDPAVAPDRRAWHHAHAASAPDELVAEQLVRSAQVARGRGGLAAAAAFLERATELTPRPADRAERALAAGQANLEAGAPDVATRLLAAAEASGALQDRQAAQVDLLRGRIALLQRRGREAPELLVAAATRLEPIDPGLARETYLEALAAGNLVGRLGDDYGILEVAAAARGGPAASSPPRAADVLLDGLVTLLLEDGPLGVAMVQQALDQFCAENLTDEELAQWAWFASHVALCVWDYESHIVLAERLLSLARRVGAIGILTIAIYTRVGAHLGAGELSEATTLLTEAKAIAEATGTSHAAYIDLCLAALKGSQHEVLDRLQSTRDELAHRGEGIGLATVQWAGAVMYNALERYDEALEAIQGAGEHPEELHFSAWGSLELIEAAVRCGRRDLAETAVERLSMRTRASGTPLALGVEARSRALLMDSPHAESGYREAVIRIGRTSARMELARTHLLFGEWLLAEGRGREARTELRAASDMFTRMGLRAFADRAERNLRAAGDRSRSRAVQETGPLTEQEERVALLAVAGLSNSEIGARLVVSSRTVEYHLHKVFVKLGVSSRAELGAALGQASA